MATRAAGIDAAGAIADARRCQAGCAGAGRSEDVGKPAFQIYFRRRPRWVDTVEKVFSHRRAQILRAVGAPTRKLRGGTRRLAVSSPATSVVELRAYRMAIAACFVFQHEISRSVFWDFFDSIGQNAKNST